VSSPLLDVCREFTANMANPFDVADLLHRLTDHAVTITSACGAGIMLAGRGGLGFAAASGDHVIDVEVTQDRIGGGPCHSAYEGGQRVVVDDLRAEDRWPEYRRRAIDLGFGSVVAVPMIAWGQTIGTLDIYRWSPAPWTEADVDAAEVLTGMGAAYVLHANQVRAQHELADQLQAALESRDQIGQAKGLLMERHGVDAEAAFEMLRSVSQRSNVKLRDVAVKLIESESSRARC
jgi:GAF domain-containing protein